MRKPRHRRAQPVWCAIVLALALAAVAVHGQAALYESDGDAATAMPPVCTAEQKKLRAASSACAWFVPFRCLIARDC
jgi:hypothetical protein